MATDRPTSLAPGALDDGGAATPVPGTGAGVTSTEPSADDGDGSVTSTALSTGDGITVATVRTSAGDSDASVVAVPALDAGAVGFVERAPAPSAATRTTGLGSADSGAADALGEARLPRVGAAFGAATTVADPGTLPF